MYKLKVKHRGVPDSPAFIVEINEGPFLKPTGHYNVNHGRIPLDVAFHACELFRTKHGRIQTNHRYQIEVLSAPEVEEAETEEASTETEDVSVDPTLGQLGVTGKTAKLLTEAGVTTMSEIKACDLLAINGIGEERAEAVALAVQLWEDDHPDE